MHVWLVAQGASEENFAVFVKEFGFPWSSQQKCSREVSSLFSFIEFSRPVAGILLMEEPLPWRCYLDLPLRRVEGTRKSLLQKQHTSKVLAGCVPLSTEDSKDGSFGQPPL